ncbi:hypothetical protein RSAG8_06873, partial [Rhizoctonia solani AG-8 WAC10335]
MNSVEILKKAKKQAKKAKRGIRDCLPGANTKRRCNCNKCWPYHFMQTKRTVQNHCRKYGVHLEAQGTAPPLAETTNSPPLPPIGAPERNLDDVSMKSRNPGSETSPQLCWRFSPTPHGHSSLPAWSRSASGSMMAP